MITVMMDKQKKEVYKQKEIEKEIQNFYAKFLQKENWHKRDK